LNLDDLALFQRLDPNQVIAGINALPERLEAGWKDGLNMPLPDYDGVEQAALLSVGPAASAAAGLLLAYAQPLAPIPFVCLNEARLPAWTRGERTLVICLALHNSAAARSLASQALERGCRVLRVGDVQQDRLRASSSVGALWPALPGIAGSSATAYAFGLLLAACFRLNLLPDPSLDLNAALLALRQQQPTLLPETPVAGNPAKRMAGQMVGRWVMVFSPPALEPAARHWKTQVNLMAKALAQLESPPEGDHSSAAGLSQPEALLMQTIALFLQASSLPERSRMRLAFTRQVYQVQGINTDVIDAAGEGCLAHLWTLLHFGDYTGYYLAMANGENPAPLEVTAMLEDELDKVEPDPT
jgi:glucose/mannose-6-phosphate isomerase